jgi:hypothetical protein
MAGKDILFQIHSGGQSEFASAARNCTDKSEPANTTQSPSDTANAVHLKNELGDILIL